MSFLDDIETIYAATKVEDVWNVLTQRLGARGFDRIIYGFTQFKTAHSLGDPQDLLILSNHTPRYIDRFIGDQMYFHAPMVRWSLENTGACSWSWIKENVDALSASELKVIEFNQRLNVKAGYTISFPSPFHRSRGALALTAKPEITQEDVDAAWAKDGREILALANVAHLKIIDLPHKGSRRALTKRQREVLEWVGDGKTTQDIATIIGLTAATVEKHLRLAREALDVETTAQAVMKASMQNQIFLIDAQVS